MKMMDIYYLGNRIFKNFIKTRSLLKFPGKSLKMVWSTMQHPLHLKKKKQKKPNPLFKNLIPSSLLLGFPLHPLGCC